MLVTVCVCGEETGTYGKQSCVVVMNRAGSPERKKDLSRAWKYRIEGGAKQDRSKQDSSFGWYLGNLI